MKRKITVVLENHFDQIWRRRFRADFVWKGENFISYQKIHKYNIEEHMRLAEVTPGYKFQIETPNVVENYLNNHPENKQKLLDLYARGVLKTTNTGYVIGDSNLVGPESLIRNYLLADEFFAEFMGYTPRIANRADAFGNSAQLPQILKQFGADYVTSIYYASFDDDVWVGLDGSALCVKKHDKLGAGGGWHKYAPCPQCKGFGEVDGAVCAYCGGKGIDQPKALKRWKAPYLAPDTNDSGVLRVGGEEMMPNPEVAAQLIVLGEQENVEVALGHTDVLLQQYAKEIEQTRRGDFTGLKVRTSPEFNPNTTGGYVTHIRIKQRLVDCENKLLTGETLAAMTKIVGGQETRYGDAWREFMLCTFHDSAAGTVVDPAYDEIMELFDRVDAIAQQRYIKPESNCLFNGTGTPWSGICRGLDDSVAIIRDVAPYSTVEPVWQLPATVSKEKKKTVGLVETILTGAVEEEVREDSAWFVLENDRLLVEADDRGLCRIVHKELGVLADTEGKSRPCQWLLQSDTGSAWATLEPPYKTQDLTNYCHLVAREQGDGWQRLRYSIEPPVRNGDTVDDHTIWWDVTLVDGMDKLFFHAKVDWCSAGKRLMVRFPLAVENGQDVYGIPGGWMYREPYIPKYDWNGNNGDWCAHRFGGVESAEKSIALLNRGTPCYQIQPEGSGRSLYMTLLRSPTIPTCLHEPLSYTMKEYDGIRDDGMHTFDFALAPYGSKFADSGLFADAEAYARPLIPVEYAAEAEMPRLTQGDALITHIKPAEDGNGIIVRVTEHGGKEGTAVLTVPQWAKAVYRTDMPERKAEKLSGTDKVEIPLHRFEIATLRFVL